MLMHPGRVGRIGRIGRPVDAGIPWSIDLAYAGELRDALADPGAWGETLGPELVTNGDFSAGATGWEIGGGWSVSGGSANKVADPNAAIAQANNGRYIAGRRYRISVTVAGFAGGSIYFGFLGPNQWSTVIAENGTFSADIAPSSTPTSLYIAPASLGLVCTIDNISVREVVTGWLLPGLGGARLSGDCRTSVAMQTLADGTVGYAAHNLLLNSATMATQTVTVVSGATYTLSAYGTGSITTSGAAVATLTGTGAANRVSLTVAATTTSLTMTLTGAMDRAQLNLGPTALPYVPTTTAARYGPAIDWLAGIGVYGIRSEAARTNLFLRSTEFNDAAWNTSLLTVTPNAITAPDGTLTADKLAPNAGGGNKDARQTVTAAAVTYTISVMAKAGELGFAYANYYDGTLDRQAYFNLTTGAVASVSAGATASIVGGFAGGWYLCSITVTGVVGWNNFDLGVCAADGGRAAAGNGTSGAYLWVSQLEVGTEASSRILTRDAQVTRAADNLIVLDSGFINLTEGTLYSQWSPLAFTVRAVTLNDGTNANAFSLTHTGTNAGGDTYSAGAFQGVASGVNNSPAIGSSNKQALGYAASNGVVASNGTASAVDASFTLPVTLNQLVIGQGRSGITTSPGNCHVIALRYSRRRASGAQLQAMTA